MELRSAGLVASGFKGLIISNVATRKRSVSQVAWLLFLLAGIGLWALFFLWLLNSDAVVINGASDSVLLGKENEGRRGCELREGFLGCHIPLRLSFLRCASGLEGTLVYGRKGPGLLDVSHSVWIWGHKPKLLRKDAFPPREYTRPPSPTIRA